MGYASIVVAATGAEDDSAAVSVACDLARRHQGTVKPNAPSLGFHVLLGREPHI
jgi:hypothetical protein